MRNRNYAVLWTSQGISLLGDRFHWVAISLWVYAQTGSALSVSYAVIALMLGPAAVGLFAGVLVDRWNRKWTMILSDIFRAVLVALIPWLMSADIRLVYVDLFLVSCATAFFRPAMLATIPQMVARPQLMQANSFLTSVDTITEIAGPILAGVVVQTFGYGAAMYADAGSYLVSAFVLALISGHVATGTHGGLVASRVMSDIKEGFLYIRKDRVQLGLFALIVLAWWTVGLNSLQTPLAKGELRLSDNEFGIFNAIWGVGFLAASLLLGWYGTRLPKGRLLIAGYVGWIISSGLAGLALNSGMLYVTVFWIGFTNVLLVVTLATVIMESTPAFVLGRVLTSRQVAFAVVKAVAMLAFGALADVIGVRVAIVGMALVALSGMAVGLTLFPELVRLDGDARSRDQALPVGLGVRVLRRVLDVTIAHTDQPYSTSEQRALNVAVIPIFLAVLVGVFINDPQTGRYSLLTIGFGFGSVILVRITMNTWYRRRSPKEGSKDLGQGSTISQKEEIRQGQRTPIPTGPTSG